MLRILSGLNRNCPGGQNPVQFVVLAYGLETKVYRGAR
jgi:hypothetical protein